MVSSPPEATPTTRAMVSATARRRSRRLIRLLGQLFESQQELSYVGAGLVGVQRLE
jgi:hypothetical protein